MKDKIFYFSSVFFVLFFLSLLVSFFFISPASNHIIFAESIYYARVKNDNTYLLSSPQIMVDETNYIFEIPKTYFVKVLDEEDDIFYKVEYNNIAGYIQKSQISFVSETPNQPFAIASFRVFSPNGLQLLSLPNTSNSTIVSVIPFLTNGISYYGKIQAEESIIYKGNTWYYCKYTNAETSHFGYVYSVFCDLLTDFQDNTEPLTEIIPPDFTKETATNIVNTTDNLSKLPTTTQVALIVLACLPCLLIIYFLFKPTKIALDKTTSAIARTKRKKKKIKRLRGSDYYELFED